MDKHRFLETKKSGHDMTPEKTWKRVMGWEVVVLTHSAEEVVLIHLVEEVADNSIHSISKVVVMGVLGFTFDP